jgi:putative N6-adenine-specific DNA methylase
LHHSGAIADRFQDSIARRWRNIDFETETESDEVQNQSLFVRVKNDVFTVSLDSSGENLYRRGLKKDITAAPLRETIASALLILAQYKPPEPLIDPMSGAGSFSLEAAMLIHNIPPGWFRDFAFYRWPVFKITDKRWNHIRKHMQKEFIEKTPATVYATDVDPVACETLAKNSKAAGFSQTIQIATRDFFESIPDRWSRTPGLIVINAPFGRRIGSLEQSDRLFINLFNRLKTRWQGWKVGLVIPRRNLLKKVPFPNVPLSIRHGGLRLHLVTGRISG